MKRTGMVMAALGFLFAQTAQADWAPVKRITWTSGGSKNPALAIGPGSTVHVVWQDDSLGNYDIFYRRSPDGGGTWNAVQRLTWTSGGSEHPAIALDSSDAIHVVWADDTPGHMEIYYKRSADGGMTWSAARRITWTSDYCYYPAIAADGSDTVHVLLSNYTISNPEIFYKRSTDGGVAWSAAKRLTWTSGYSWRPAMTINPGQVIHAVWYDGPPVSTAIYYKKSTNGGLAWSADRRLTWTSSGAYNPVIAADSTSTVHVVWSDNTPGNLEIFYKKSPDGGVTWSTAKRLTWTLDKSDLPAMAMDPGNAIHVVWNDYTPGNGEIFYRKSTDAGATWGTMKRLIWNSGESREPALAIDPGGAIHVVWYDDTPGNNEIYYRKGN